MPTDQYLVYEARSNYAGKPVLKINVDGVPVVVPPQLQVNAGDVIQVVRKD